MTPKPKSYGYGKEVVYVYYYETYELYAKEHGLDYFPCKIGFTAKETVDERIQEQIAAMPEKPIVPFIIMTTWGNELEILLHNAIKSIKAIRKWNEWEINGQIYDSGGGSDWLLTSPNEIIKETRRFKQTSKGAKEILEKYNKIRTDWGNDRITAFGSLYPDINNPSPLDAVLKIERKK
jgi:hypothetical protein